MEFSSYCKLSVQGDPPDKLSYRSFQPQSSSHFFLAFYPCKRWILVTSSFVADFRHFRTHTHSTRKTTILKCQLRLLLLVLLLLGIGMLARFFSFFLDLVILHTSRALFQYRFPSIWFLAMCSHTRSMYLPPCSGMLKIGARMFEQRVVAGVLGDIRFQHSRVQT